MTFRTALARYVKDLLNEDDPRPKSHLSTTSTPTPNGSTAPPPQDPMIRMTELMLTMQRESQREMKDLVLSILQGRPQENGHQEMTPEAMAAQTLLAPDYDDESIPLSGGLMSVLDREQREEEEVRLLRAEQEGLARQLAEARTRLIQDPQGPDFTTS